MELYRIKMVEPLKPTTLDERKKNIAQASYNLFKLPADKVMIDLLTDSGTSAMSQAQWGAMIQADESYAGATSFFRFKEAVQYLTGFKHIFPTHQGRAAERLLFSVMCQRGMIIPNNTHFDTTRGNIEFMGATAQDMVIPEGLSPQEDHPFKGNMDITVLKKLLKEQSAKIPLVMLTLTNNAGGGQPVSMSNVKAVSKLARDYNKLFFIDGCRFAENAFFIKQREKGYQNRSIESIVQEIFSYADGMTMSAKKDALVNMGGWLALNDDGLADRLQDLLILTEGFPTYGGLSGRDLEAIAIGLQEVVQEDYLKERIASVAYLGKGLSQLGIPVIQPIGGHAVFVEAQGFLPHIPPLSYPGHALGVELYIEAGARGVEIGSLMFGSQPDGSEKPAKLELLRLAIPRRVYTRSHWDHVIEGFRNIQMRKDQIQGYKITWQANHLRHFSAQLSPAA